MLTTGKPYPILFDWNSERISWQGYLCSNGDSTWFFNWFLFDWDSDMLRWKDLLFEPGRKLSVDKAYVLRSLNLIADLVYSIIAQVREKYGHFTVLPLLKELFAYNFTSPIIKFEKFCVLNEGNDIYDGPFNMPAGRASSENFFLEFWQAQRDGSALNRAAMVHLGGSVRKVGIFNGSFW